MNGFANAKNNPMPTLIIAIASRNAMTRNIRAQHRGKLRLTRRALEEASAQDAHAHGDANGKRNRAASPPRSNSQLSRVPAILKLGAANRIDAARIARAKGAIADRQPRARRNR